MKCLQYRSEEELAELKGTRLLSTTLGVEEYVENEFSKLEQDILLPNKDMFPICQNLFLIPLADLINSRPELKKIWCLAYPAEQNSRPELKKILLVWSQTA
ncbi:hypothetical protein YC2023_070048 [Brassica napus]